MTDAPSGSAVRGAVGLSIIGLLVHNLAEFPAAILVSVETLFPLLVTMAIGGMRHRPGHASFALGAAWALIVIVVGGGSALPLSVLPFEPDGPSATTRSTSSTRRPSFLFSGCPGGD